MDGDVGLTLDHVDTVAWVLIGGGALLLLGGLATIGLAVRRRPLGLSQSCSRTPGGRPLSMAARPRRVRSTGSTVLPRASSSAIASAA